MEKAKQTILCKTIQKYYLSIDSKLINEIRLELLNTTSIVTTRSQKEIEKVSEHLQLEKQNLNIHNRQHEIDLYSTKYNELKIQLYGLRLVKDILSVEFKAELPDEKRDKIIKFCNSLNNVPVISFLHIGDYYERIFEYAKSINISDNEYVYL